MSATHTASLLLLVIPAKAGIQRLCCSKFDWVRNESPWIPAFAGMTAEKTSAMRVAA
ncbi:MAG: hypothetical protein WKF61_03540 [Luteimonas sp.]